MDSEVQSGWRRYSRESRPGSIPCVNAAVSSTDTIMGELLDTLKVRPFDPDIDEGSEWTWDDANDP